MQHIDSFELNTPQVAALRLRAGSRIRVTSGRLWLTVQGGSSDIWLQTGQEWTLHSKHATLWLSAEPSAAFQIARPVARRASYLLPPAVHAAVAAVLQYPSRVWLKLATLSV